jgi:hypothetical protein
MNDDGNDDLIIRYDSAIKYSLSDGFNFKPFQSLKLDYSSDIYMGDINCDGMDDLILFYDNEINVLFCDRLNEAGLLQKDYLLKKNARLFSGIDNTNKLAIAKDYNNDCLQDILIFDYKENEFVLLLTEYDRNRKLYSQAAHKIDNRILKGEIITILSENLIFENGWDSGRNEILIYSQSNSYFEMGLYSIEKNSAKNFAFHKIYSKQFAQKIHNVDLADIEGDSIKEIVFTSNQISDSLTIEYFKFYEDCDRVQILHNNNWKKIYKTDRYHWGDFNGDGYDDICYFYNDSIYIELTNNPIKQVGTFLSLWYHPQNASWSKEMVDVNKTPAVGWAKKKN